jgi:hypothetical protein
MVEAYLFIIFPKALSWSKTVNNQNLFISFIMKLSMLFTSAILLTSLYLISATNRANLDTTHDIYFEDLKVTNGFSAKDVKVASVHTSKLSTNETKIVALLTEQIMNPSSDTIKVTTLSILYL